MGPIEMMYLIAGQRLDRQLPPESTTPLVTPMQPEELLDRAASRAGTAVSYARKTLGKPEHIATLRQRWRKLSGVLMICAPVMLAGVIAGSVIQTNSRLIETLWEATAAAMLLGGIALAFADSRSFYLKDLQATQANTQLEELAQLALRSQLAAAWQAVIVKEGRTPHQFDLDIMWALVASETPEADAMH